MGFDIGHAFPQKITMTDGNGNERNHSTQLVKSGQTGAYDCGYQYYSHIELTAAYVTLAYAVDDRIVFRMVKTSPKSVSYYRQWLTWIAYANS